MVVSIHEAMDEAARWWCCSSEMGLSATGLGCTCWITDVKLGDGENIGVKMEKIIRTWITSFDY
jgi:hypothetical protein